jgi:hypothetical protein
MRVGDAPELSSVLAVVVPVVLMAAEVVQTTEINTTKGEVGLMTFEGCGDR